MSAQVGTKVDLSARDSLSLLVFRNDSTMMLAFSHLLAFVLTLTAATPLDRRSPALDSCLSAAGLSPISSSSPDYSSIVIPFNLRLQRFPAAVVFPTSIEAVSEAVKCGKRLGVAVVARGGGHSYVSWLASEGSPRALTLSLQASYGLGATNGALMIDLGSLKSIVVDSDGTAHVQGGALLGDTALALNSRGRAMSHGVCPWVGIGGHAAFGGELGAEGSTRREALISSIPCRLWPLLSQVGSHFGQHHSLRRRARRRHHQARIDRFDRRRSFLGECRTLSLGSAPLLTPIADRHFEELHLPSASWSPTTSEPTNVPPP